MGGVLSAICLPCLHCIGFTAGGIAKGSGAACYQAGVGLVAAGSCFAQCQSAAASSSLCGCLSVALCWVVVLGALLLWIFGFFSSASSDAIFEGNSTTTSVLNWTTSGLFNTTTATYGLNVTTSGITTTTLSSLLIV